MTFKFTLSLFIGFFFFLPELFATQGAYPQVGDTSACGGGRGVAIQSKISGGKVPIKGAGDGYSRKFYSLQKTGPHSVSVGVNPKFTGHAAGQVKQIFDGCLPFTLAVPEIPGGAVSIQYDPSAPQYYITATETRKGGSGVPYWNHWPLRWTSTTGGRAMKLNCGIIRHELMHAIGLPDEYALSAHGNGGGKSCNGSRNNIMNIYANTNTAGLAADQFLVIAMPYCASLNSRFAKCIPKRKACSTPISPCNQHANIAGPTAPGGSPTTINGDYLSQSNLKGSSLFGEDGKGGALGSLLQGMQGGDEKEDDEKNEQAQTAQCTLSSEELQTLTDANTALPSECSNVLVVGSTSTTDENAETNNNEAGEVVSLDPRNNNQISTNKLSSNKVSSVEGEGHSPASNTNSEGVLASKANWKSGWSEAVLLDSDGNGNAIEGEGTQQNGDSSLGNTPASNYNKRSIAQENKYEPGGPYTPASLKNTPEIDRRTHRLLFENIHEGFSRYCLSKVGDCNNYELQKFRQ